MEFVKIWLISLFAVLVLVACGGGGVSGDAPATGVAIAITADNAAQITGAVVGSVDDVQGLSEEGIGSLLGVSVQTNNGGFNNAEFVFDQIDRFAVVGNQALANGIVGVTINLPPEDCLVDGTIIISGTVDNEFTVTAGDSLSLIFDKCDEGLGVVLDGRLELTVGNFSPVGLDFDNPLPPYTIPVEVILTDLSATDAGGQVFVGNGDMMLTLVENIDDFKMSISGNSLTSTENGMVSKLSDYFYEMTGSYVIPEYQLSMNGTLESDEIGGWVSFETTEVFEGIGEDPPYAGVLLITGANNSKCELISEPNDVAAIRVDADGNDEFEETIMTTWPCPC